MKIGILGGLGLAVGLVAIAGCAGASGRIIYDPVERIQNTAEGGVSNFSYRLAAAQTGARFPVHLGGMALSFQAAAGTRWPGSDRRSTG